MEPSLPQPDPLNAAPPLSSADQQPQLVLVPSSAAREPDQGRIVSAAAPPMQPISAYPQLFRECAAKVREKYASLYELPVVEYADGTRTFHNAVRYHCHGLNVLFLKGDLFEMAFQHGRLLFDQIPDGAPPHSAKMVTNNIANAYGVGKRIANFLGNAVHRVITKTMLKHSITATCNLLGQVEALHDGVALSESTGLSTDTLVQALFNPETLLLLARASNNAHGHRVRLLDQVVPPVCCCSSFVAWDNQTDDGDMLIGRNLDYPLNGYFDRFPTVIYYEPTFRCERYMTIVSAGVQNGGLSSYNESGIFLSSHTVPTNDMSVRGVPVFTTANQVIRRARTFDMAVKLFQQFRPPTGWAYLLASTKERRVGTVELSNGKVAVRESDADYHVQTNHYLTPDMQACHMFLNTSVAEDNDARFVRIQDCLEEARGKVDTRKAIEILSDQVDPLVNEVRGVGNTVGVHTNMSSLVLEPQKQRIYVSTGRGPASHGEFLELPLIGNCDRESFREWPQRLLQNTTFRDEHPEKWQALQLFIQAKRTYENENNTQEAYQLLQQVVAADPSNPAYFFQLGIFALKNKLYEEAIDAFTQVFQTPYQTDQLARLGHYYRGRSHAHLGHKQEALDDLTVVAEDSTSDNKLRTAARRARTRVKTFGRYRLSRRSLGIMMQQSDMLAY